MPAQFLTSCLTRLSILSAYVLWHRRVITGRGPARYPGDHQIPAMWAHPAALKDGRMDRALYAIRINGHLGAMLLSAFPAMVTQQPVRDRLSDHVLTPQTWHCWRRPTRPARGSPFQEGVLP